MKQFLFILGITIVITSCIKGDHDLNYIRVGDKQANLYDAIFYDDGTNENDITYRRYPIKIMDNDLEPSYYIQFLIFSNSTTELVEGSYTYAFDARRGNFSFLKVGAGLRIDATGNYIAGDVYDDDDGVQVLGGSVDISRDRSKYVFDFFITLVKNIDTVDVEGHYKGHMKNQYFDIYEYDSSMPLN